MDFNLILEFLVILGALAMGARAGGVGLGLWGAVGLLAARKASSTASSTKTNAPARTTKVR
jgi:anaerobic C4-dicarboxylate transporter